MLKKGEGKHDVLSKKPASLFNIFLKRVKRIYWKILSMLLRKIKDGILKLLKEYWGFEIV
jgi:hypothetical protein